MAHDPQAAHAQRRRQSRVEAARRLRQDESNPAQGTEGGLMQTWWAVQDGQGRKACFVIQNGRPETANALFSPELEALLYSAVLIECETKHDGKFLVLYPKQSEVERRCRTSKIGSKMLVLILT